MAHVLLPMLFTALRAILSAIPQANNLPETLTEIRYTAMARILYITVPIHSSSKNMDHYKILQWPRYPEPPIPSPCCSPKHSTDSCR
ncbi:hypothetical protein HPB50_016094 [Hyalomma asiaticum]|uniref:Uncharacterized protein n=1 Tax=Hyalomma asiaticum TaxID=266040 RepID=A0ACB7SWN0_HYAAI|nr:hypothetical protein HPB50_016094 [Hyalomma asiaticum]